MTFLGFPDRKGEEMKQTPVEAGMEIKTTKTYNDIEKGERMKQTPIKAGMDNDKIAKHLLKIADEKADYKSCLHHFANCEDCGCRINILELARLINIKKEEALAKTEREAKKEVINNELKMNCLECGKDLHKSILEKKIRIHLCKICRLKPVSYTHLTLPTILLV